jgi:alanine-synthesizing transaminase
MGDVNSWFLKVLIVMIEEYELSPLEQTLLQRKVSGKPWINLIDSSFHSNGFFPDQQHLAQRALEYFSSRTYHPDPLGDLEARKAICRYYEQRNLSFEPEQIMITASSSESYTLLFNQIGDPGDRVLLPLPGYPLFESLAEYTGLIPDFYPLDPEQDWLPDLEVLESLIQPTTRFLVVISPNNPTGSVFTPNHYHNILTIAQNHSLLIIHDEVFSEYIWSSGDQDQTHQLPTDALLSQVNTPVVLINGISKICASPDLKLSWMAQSNLPAIWRNRLELANDTYLNANGLSQYLLPGLLKTSLQPGGVAGDVLKVLKDNETTLYAKLQDASLPSLRLTIPNPTLLRGGIHRILQLADSALTLTDEEVACRILENHGVYLHPGSLYGHDDLFDDSMGLVISLLKKPEEFNRGLNQLIDAIRENS